MPPKGSAKAKDGHQTLASLASPASRDSSPWCSDGRVAVAANPVGTGRVALLRLPADPIASEPLRASVASVYLPAVMAAVGAYVQDGNGFEAWGFAVDILVVNAGLIPPNYLSTMDDFDLEGGSGDYSVRNGAIALGLDPDQEDAQLVTEFALKIGEIFLAMAQSEGSPGFNFNVDFLRRAVSPSIQRAQILKMIQKLSSKPYCKIVAR
eukprot:3111604-Amphidinium_carterae.1